MAVSRRPSKLASTFRWTVAGLLSATLAVPAAADYGQVHPDAPEATAQLAPLAGAWLCQGESLQQDGTYAAGGEATWTFRWILDGYALMDEWRGPDGPGVNIRHVDPETGRWVAKWISSSNMSWETYDAGMVNDTFVMTCKSTAPNGTRGDARATFHDIQDKTFLWSLDWSINEGETWIPGVAKLSCRRLP